MSRPSSDLLFSTTPQAAATTRPALRRARPTTIPRRPSSSSFASSCQLVCARERGRRRAARARAFVDRCCVLLHNAHVCADGRVVLPPRRWRRRSETAATPCCSGAVSGMTRRAGRENSSDVRTGAAADSSSRFGAESGPTPRRPRPAPRPNRRRARAEVLRQTPRARLTRHGTRARANHAGLLPSARASEVRPSLACGLRTDNDENKRVI